MGARFAVFSAGVMLVAGIIAFARGPLSAPQKVPCPKPVPTLLDGEAPVSAP